jgi:hypothetical protein
MLQYGATKVSSDSEIARINWQCKLATLRRENKKFNNKPKFVQQMIILRKG